MFQIARNTALALAVPVLTLVLARDGLLARGEGLVLLVVFAGWLTLVVWQAMARRRQTSAEVATGARPAHAWLMVLGGLLGVVLAGRLFVAGASGIAATLGGTPLCDRCHRRGAGHLFARAGDGGVVALARP